MERVTAILAVCLSDRITIHRLYDVSQKWLTLQIAPILLFLHCILIINFRALKWHNF